MRKARHWWIAEFFPENSEDFMKVSSSLGTQENNWFRQVLGYWGMATSFVLQGILNEDLFLQPAFSGEMFLIFAKIQPFLKEFREKLGDKQVFRSIEEVATRTKFGRERLQLLAKRVEIMRQKRAERKAS
jgi:hypothetical protein